MKKYLAVVAFLLGFTAFGGPQPQVVGVAPNRIVALAPSLGELAADLVAEDTDRIVGVSDYSDYPPILKKKTSIGAFHQFSVEKVVSLKPDLVLATKDGNPKESVEKLKKLGIRVEIVSTSDFAEIAQSIEQIGNAVGNPKLGKELAGRFNKKLDEFRARASERNKKSGAPVKVLLQLSDRPLVVAGGKSFLGAALKILGAENLYEDAKQPYPRPSFEDVLKKNPDKIIILALGMPDNLIRSMQKNWTDMSQLKAKKTGGISVIRDESVARPTVRILEGLSLLEHTLYGKN